MTSTRSPSLVRHAFTVPDGSQITVDAPASANGVQWNCLFVARIFGAGHAFTLCQRGTAEHLASALRLTDIRVEPYRNADLMLTYDTTDFDALEHGETVAAWRGPWHELHIARTGPRQDPESFTRVLDALILTDTADGLLIRPQSTRAVTFEPFTVFADFLGFGHLQIQRPHEAEITVPDWRGAPARSGEIWRRSLTGGEETGRARQEALILASPTAVCELVPGPLDTPDSDAAAEFLATIDLSWSQA